MFSQRDLNLFENCSTNVHPRHQLKRKLHKTLHLIQFEKKYFQAVSGARQIKPAKFQNTRNSSGENNGKVAVVDSGNFSPTFFRLGISTHIHKQRKRFHTKPTPKLFSQLLIKRVKFLRVFAVSHFIPFISLEQASQTRDYINTATPSAGRRATYGRNWWKSVSNAPFSVLSTERWAKFSSTLFAPFVGEDCWKEWRQVGGIGIDFMFFLCIAALSGKESFWLLRIVAAKP